MTDDHVDFDEIRREMADAADRLNAEAVPYLRGVEAPAGYGIRIHGRILDEPVDFVHIARGPGDVPTVWDGLEALLHGLQMREVRRQIEEDE